ncbi:MAG TPA: hypothetical protein VFX19_07690 [Dehalococcoidia bacterium]|nr:hypothetical protein [Dehalococcoidia bacterium]
MKSQTDAFRDKDNFGAGPELAAGLEAVYRVTVPDLQMPPAVSSPNPPRRSHRLRPFAALAAAVAGVAFFVIGSSLWGGRATEVSAETILQRTAGVAKTNTLAAGATSYHMVAETRYGMDEGKQGSQTTETWFRDPEHVRVEEHAGGSSTVDLGQSRDGDDFWLYGTFSGTNRAIHGPAGELGFGIVPGPGTGGTSLQNVLTQISSKGCSTATVQREDEVAGRTAYVIEVKPRWDSCAETRGVCKGACPEGAEKLSRDTSTLLWVDKETFLTLRSDFFTEGRVVSSYLVTQLEVDADLPSEVFRYQPPAGVQVIEVTNGADAKRAFAGIEDEKSVPGGPPAQSSKPESLPEKPTTP